MRDRIRQWQPKLRALFLMRIASVKYRLQLPGFELPEAVRDYQREYDACSGDVLEKMADAIEGKPVDITVCTENTLEPLQRVLEACCSPESGRLPTIRVQSFIALLREIDQLTASLANEIATSR